MAVLPKLMRRHEVQILAGGDAYHFLAPEYPVQRIPTMRYYYGKRSQRATFQTFIRNTPIVLDILLVGPAFESVCESIEGFRPDVIVSDAEVYAHRAARRLGIPRIGFDHYGVLVYCRPDGPWMDRLNTRFESLSYRRMMGRPERVIVSSFYPAKPRGDGVEVIPPILRAEVRRTKPTRGDHLLVYLNQGEHQYTPRLERTLRSYDGPVRIYGLRQRPPKGNLHYHPLSNLPFVEDLASCTAVVSSAGNQLVGEAIHFGKPMLVIPERTVEQRLNAHAIEELGVGKKTTPRRISPRVLAEFLDRGDWYRDQIARRVGDGLDPAVAAIDRYVTELAAPSRPAAKEAKPRHEMA